MTATETATATQTKPGILPSGVVDHKLVDAFLVAAQNVINEWYAKNGTTPENTPYLAPEFGNRYMRVVKCSRINPASRSVYCFIDLGTGDILKADGWKRPARNGVRGNVAADDHGVSCVDWSGCKYLR